MHEKNFLAIGSWLAIAAGLWIIAWIIAEAIPVFSDLLGLITALFASWFTCKYWRRRKTELMRKRKFANHESDGLSGIFWLFMNWGKYFSSPRKICLTILNLTIVGIGGALVSFP